MLSLACYNIDMNEEIFLSDETDTGRSFSSVINRDTSRYDRAQAMQVGDFITIDSRIFAQWVGRVLDGDPSILENSEPVRLTIESISYRDDEKRQPDKVVVVSSNGVRKEVDASLFYSHGRVPKDIPYMASGDGGSGFGDKNSDPHAGGW